MSLLLERGAAAGNLRTFVALGDMEAVADCFDQSGVLTVAAGEIGWPFDSSTIPECVRRDPEQIINNALVYAAAWGHSDAVEFLLDHGASSTPFPPASTTRHRAALCRSQRPTGNGHPALAHGADVAIPDAKIGKLAEDWANHGGHQDLADHLRQVRLQAS